MRTTIDGAGRIVIPKSLRQELGFGPGQPLELTAIDGRLAIELPATDMRLAERGGDLIAQAEAPMPPLTADAVRDTLERVRR